MISVSFLFVTFVDSFLFSTLDRAKVQVLLTTGDQSKKLSQEADLYPLHDNNNLPQININKNQRYQTMEGFGAGLSNSAASVIYHSPKRHEIMRQLFSPTDGIGEYYFSLQYSLLRLHPHGGLGLYITDVKPVDMISLLRFWVYAIPTVFVSYF